MVLELLAITIAVIIIIFFLIYNRFVSLRNSVRNSWASIDVQLKRRRDLIPNLVRTVKGYAKYEKDLLTKITKLRNLTKNPEEDIKKTAAEDELLSKDLKSVFAIAENYPKLKANENFLKLQEELTETEDEIAAARRIYNNNVRAYNTSIASFPQLIIARLFGFEKEDFFRATTKERELVEASIEV